MQQFSLGCAFVFLSLQHLIPKWSLQGILSFVFDTEKYITKLCNDYFEVAQNVFVGLLVFWDMFSQLFLLENDAA